MTGTNRITASCTCGQVMLEAVGTPILSAACYCESCRSAARQFEQVPGAPTVLNGDGGVDYCLYRKDRVSITRGREHLQAHCLREGSATRRLAARCCNTPMILDFTNGHWLTLFRDRLAAHAPPIEMAVMTQDIPAGHAFPGSVPAYAKHPARFMIKLLAAWAAMGFRRSGWPGDRSA